MGPLGLLILDQEGEVLFSNVGEEILTAFPSFSALCAQVVSGAGPESSLEMIVRPSGNAPWRAVRVVALKKRMEDPPAVVAVFVEPAEASVEAVDVSDVPVHSHFLKVNGTFKFSRRETEVIAGVEVGMTDKQIATKLGVSPETVRGYLKAVRAKLGVSTRTAILHKINTSQVA